MIKNRATRAIVLLMTTAIVCGLFVPLAAMADSREATSLGNAYLAELRPLLETYCYDCHGAGDVAEGEIDLAAIDGWDAAGKHPQTWQKVAEMLSNRLMPPEDAAQPTEDERAQLQQWLNKYLKLEATSRAGDPGRVVLRRLNNAEYTYTLRDLTGIKSLDPAREFPVDGAAGEGFTNTGNALVMSPAFVTKYLDAAKEVASHAVLLPDGFRFSEHTTPRDWTNEILTEIREFYSRFADDSGASQVNLQGIVFDTNQGGRLPVERYLAATLAEREAIQAGKKSIEVVAREHTLSAKYLGTLWAALTSAEPSLLLDELRARWNKAAPADAPALAADVADWQKSLWKFSSVGQVGRDGGPKRWMEPAESLTDAQKTWLDFETLGSDTAGRQRLETAFEDYRQLFPLALCYKKIVPVDEVVTLILFHREDDHLQRLMLDDAQVAELDRLWDELHFVSQDALKQVDVLEQLIEYATQDADPKVFEPLTEPTAARAAAFRQRLVDCEPKQIEALIEFAPRVYRRPLSDNEADGLRELYSSLRRKQMPHDEAFRLTLARMLVSPAFLYRLEKPAVGERSTPVSDWELANRLSYFLWSSLPDDELMSLAAAGTLHEPEILAAQSRRMLQDRKARRLATEFACQWLHIYDFDQLDEKSDRHFPTFVGLRKAMYRESIEFFTHLFADNESVLDILDADYTYLNEKLAEHYGIPSVEGKGWRRIDGVKKYSRGGVLAQATTLAKQSGASRTSPILRGNWISEVILGERLPKPPKGVPPLPDDEAATEGLTMRQLVEKHVSDPKCSVCHQRIDPYGFSLEAFDAIGRHREKDLGDRPVDTKVTAMDGAEFEGLDGLRNYLLTERRDAFVRQFCRKMLGYALGRSVQLSDEPLLAEMQDKLAANEYKVAVAVETIVRSKQFREIRGMDAMADLD
jgi:hypothetical protein